MSSVTGYYNSAPDVLLIISNIAFFAPAIKAHYLHRNTRAVIYTLMVFASSFYHACNSYTGLCLFPPNIQRKVDFFFAQWLIPLTALYVIKFSPDWYFLERWLIFLFAVAIFTVEVFYNEPFVLQLIIAGISLLLIIGYWVCFAICKAQSGEKPRIPKYDWGYFALGIIATAVACTLFTVQNSWHLGYWMVHSEWHVLAGLGQFFILCIRDGASPYANLDKDILFMDQFFSLSDKQDENYVYIKF